MHLPDPSPAPRHTNKGLSFFFSFFPFFSPGASSETGCRPPARRRSLQPPPAPLPRARPRLPPAGMRLSSSTACASSQARCAPSMPPPRARRAAAAARTTRRAEMPELRGRLRSTAGPAATSGPASAARPAPRRAERPPPRRAGMGAGEELPPEGAVSGEGGR